MVFRLFVRDFAGGRVCHCRDDHTWRFTKARPHVAVTCAAKVVFVDEKRRRWADVSDSEDEPFKPKSTPYAAALTYNSHMNLTHSPIHVESCLGVMISLRTHVVHRRFSTKASLTGSGLSLSNMQSCERAFLEEAVSTARVTGQRPTSSSGSCGQPRAAQLPSTVGRSTQKNICLQNSPWATLAKV